MIGVSGLMRCYDSLLSSRSWHTGNVNEQVDDINQTVSRANENSRRAIAEAKDLENLITNAPEGGEMSNSLEDVEEKRKCSSLRDQKQIMKFTPNSLNS